MCMEGYIRCQTQLLLKLPMLSHHSSEWDTYLLLCHYGLHWGPQADAPHMGLAILEPGRTHFRHPRQLPRLSRQRLFPPKAPNPPGHSQNSELSQMRANEVCYSGLRCCISLSLILCFVTDPFQNVTNSWKKHPSPKFKSPASLVQLTSQSSQILKHNMTGKKSRRKRVF